MKIKLLVVFLTFAVLLTAFTYEKNRAYYFIYTKDNLEELCELDSNLPLDSELYDSQTDKPGYFPLVLNPYVRINEHKVDRIKNNSLKILFRFEVRDQILRSDALVSVIEITGDKTELICRTKVKGKAFYAVQNFFFKQES